MLPMPQKHILITAALLASLSLTACGKKKDIIAPPPATTPTPTNDQAGQAPQNNQTTEDTNGQIGGGLPDPNSTNDDNEPPKPGPLPQAPSTPKTPTPATPATPAKPATPPVVDTRPTPSVGTNPLPSDYRANDPGNVSKDNLSKRMTGGVTPEGLVYTSSSTDELLNFLRARNEKVSYETRRLNLEAAASVASAKLSVDGFSGDAIVTLKIQEGNEVKVYNLAGATAEGGPASALRLVRAGNGEKSTGLRAVDGTLKCMDLDGGCENIFARVKIGSAGSSAIINVVFRNSSADLYFHLPGEYSSNPEYLTIRDFIISTIQGLKVSEKIKTVRMNSWEVVNGRSGVTLSIKGGNSELLAFAGPLLAPEAGTGVNISLSRLTKDTEDTLDLISLDNTKMNYANSISEARMVANNGLGQIRILLKMRKRGDYAQDQFTATFMRRVKPLVDLTDDNLK